MKIYAPNKNANGVYASVLFVNGVGETDNPRLIEWFKSHGYRLEKGDVTVFEPQKPLDFKEGDIVEYNGNKYQCVGNDKIEPQSDKVEKSFEDMTPNELRQWMMENGFGSKIRNTRNKEKLLEILRG